MTPILVSLFLLYSTSLAAHTFYKANVSDLSPPPRLLTITNHVIENNSSDLFWPEVGSLDDGGFVVAWEANDGGTGKNIYAQVYN